uniref:Uncharacterized protein n=1 Tax=Moniliophthora roreri TaxID=221103 RepID=A0A0W0FVZ0_MONRR
MTEGIQYMSKEVSRPQALNQALIRLQADVALITCWGTYYCM